jgi:hypothetical protein
MPAPIRVRRGNTAYKCQSDRPFGLHVPRMTVEPVVGDSHPREVSEDDGEELEGVSREAGYGLGACSYPGEGDEDVVEPEASG